MKMYQFWMEALPHIHINLYDLLTTDYVENNSLFPQPKSHLNQYFGDNPVDNVDNL